MHIKDKGFFWKLYWYIKRVITNSGPHSKGCGCNKWGSYVGGGCPSPGFKLEISNGQKN